MQRFSIKDLENFTGIKAHTIRAWEQRYNLLNPERTATNIRFYTDKDLKTLLNVNLLNKRGIKISKIAGLSESQIEKLILNDITSESQDDKNAFNLLKVAMLNYNEVLFHEITAKYLEKFGVLHTFVNLFLPFMNQMGVLWLSSAICPAQEHFISNLIRQKLSRLIDDLGPSSIKEGEDTMVLFLPEDEMHEISLLLAYYLLKSAGMRVVYLGQNVPFDDLLTIVNRCERVRFVSICSTQPHASKITSYLMKVTDQFEGKDVEFHFTGPVFRDSRFNKPEWMSIYENAEEMMKQLVPA